MDKLIEQMQLVVSLAETALANRKDHDASWAVKDALDKLIEQLYLIESESTDAALAWKQTVDHLTYDDLIVICNFVINLARFSKAYSLAGILGKQS